MIFSQSASINCHLQPTSNGATTFSIMTLSIPTFSTMTLSIKGPLVTHRINNIQHKTLCFECHYAECRYAMSPILIVMLNVIMLSLVMPGVVMLYVAAPREGILAQHALHL